MATLSKRTYPSGKQTWLVRWVDRDGFDRKKSLGDVRYVSEADAIDIFERTWGARKPIAYPQPVDTVKQSTSISSKGESEVVLQSYIALVKDLLAKEQVQPSHKIQHSDADSLVIMLSDAHFGKVIPGKYDAKVAAARIEEFGNRIVHLVTEHVSEVDEVVLALLGDLVDGWGIYPGQSFRVENAVPEQVYLAAKAIWAMIIHLHSSINPRAFRIKCAPGNHGRVNKDAHIDTNWDMALYYTLKLLATQYNRMLPMDAIMDDDDFIEFQQPCPIEIELPAATEFLNFEVKNHTIHMRHKAPSNTETPAGRAKFAGWLAKHNFDIMIYGDLHHFGLTDILGKMIMRNASLFGDDDYSESLGLASKPGQFIFGVSKNHAPSFIYPIFFE